MMRKSSICIATVLLAGSLLLSGCGKTDNADMLSYRDYGITCLNSGDYENAVTAFQAALSCTNTVGETEIDICLYEAKAQALSGDTEGAFATLTAIIELKGTPSAYLQRGNLYLATGQMDLAIADYQLAVKKAGKDYALYISIYESLVAYGDMAEAQSFLTEAASLSGEKPTDHFYKGRIALLMGDYDNARSLLESAADDGIEEANFYLGKVYSAMGDDAVAMSYYQLYTSSENASEESIAAMGLAELEIGEYAQAIALLESARTLYDGVNPEVWTGLAVAYENQYDFASAYAVLSEYCEAYPDDEAAARELVFLATR